MLSSVLNELHDPTVLVEDDDLVRIDALKNNPNAFPNTQTISMAIGIIEFIHGSADEATNTWHEAGIAPAAALKLRADDAHSNGLLDEALAFYQYSVQSDPNLPEVWHEMGIIQEEKGNKTGALEAYEKAWALNNIDSVEPLGSLYNEMRQFDLAIQTWKRALSEYPNYSSRVVWWRNLLISMRSANMWRELVPSARAAISEFPNDAQLYIELGFALQNNSSSFIEASDAFTTAIRLNEELPSAYAAMGNLMAQNQEFEDAIYWYSEAISRTPENAALHVLRANMARATGNLPQALAFYETANRQFPENARILHEMAWTYRQADQKAEALASLDKALDLEPVTSADFLLRAGLIFEWAQEKARAIGIYQELLMLEPENEVARARLESLQP
jgi:superkiller protein 3